MRGNATSGRGKPRGITGLRRRRAMRSARRCLAALCAGIAVFAALSCVAETVETQRIVVAASDIARGSVIDGSLLRVAEVPASAAFDSAIGAVEELGAAVSGASSAGASSSKSAAVAQVDIAAGQPLFRSMIGARPAVPDGHAVVEVRLSSAPDALTVGDEVSLATTSGCAADDSVDKEDEEDTATSDVNDDATDTGDEPGNGPDNDAPDDPAGRLSDAQQSDTQQSDTQQSDTQQSDESVPIASCTLAKQATVMAVPRATDGVNSFRGGDAALVSLAMPSDDAMRVLAAQESGPVIAVSTGTAGVSVVR